MSRLTDRVTQQQQAALENQTSNRRSTQIDRETAIDAFSHLVLAASCGPLLGNGRHDSSARRMVPME